MPSSAMTTVASHNQRRSFTPTAALVIAFAVAIPCHVGFGEARPSDTSGSALSDGRRAMWVLESGISPSQIEESLLDVGARKHKRSQNSANPSMWFGPRLGRRRRSISEADLNGPESGNMATSSGSGEFADDIAFASLFREAPWSLRELQQRAWLNMPDRSEAGDDRRVVNFTPRLGRESGEELLDSHLALPPQPPPAPPAQVQLSAALRSPPFAPRLGRGLLFSPRMGRSSAPAISPR